MSRGLGRVEQFIVEILDLELALGVASGPEIARTITGGADAPTVRRALKRLEAKGIIVPLPKREGRAILWVLTETAKGEAKRQRRKLPGTPDDELQRNMETIHQTLEVWI